MHRSLSPGQEVQRRAPTLEKVRRILPLVRLSLYRTCLTTIYSCGLRLQDGKVTLSYKESATDQLRFSTLPAEEFIRRFLQHVLPKGFVKVRYYGLLAASNRPLLDQARQLLSTAAAQSIPSNADCRRKDQLDLPRCPKCGAALRLVERLKPKTRWPP